MLSVFHKLLMQLIGANVIILGTTAPKDFDKFDNSFDIDLISAGKYELHCADGSILNLICTITEKLVSL